MKTLFKQPRINAHCQNANQPRESALLDPNKNWVTELDQAVETPRTVSVYLNRTRMSAETRLDRGRISDLPIASISSSY
jgi:hypothetical protein